jgi:hypothetical protein
MMIGFLKGFQCLIGLVHFILKGSSIISFIFYFGLSPNAPNLICRKILSFSSHIHGVIRPLLEKY